MIEGVIWAILAGLMLGLYALPEKYTRGFTFENTWGLFFILTMFLVPIIASASLIEGFGNIFNSVDADILIKMALASFLWGIGVMLWGKAINHIGLSLGFSLFIGTVILVGSLLPFLVEGIPKTNTFLTIVGGIFVVLLGVIANGKAGILREKDEASSKKEKASVLQGIMIAVVGGLLATGFSYANAIGRPSLHEAAQATGNAEWVTAVVVMFPIFISGGIVIAAYFSWELSKNKSWSKFKTPNFPKNLGLILIMAVFHYAAFKLGSVGNTVGYAIFNTTCVATAVVSGIVTREWVKASKLARTYLYIGLACMIIGVLIIAFGNSLSS
ncbi:MAG: L-rhamnose/proton symporter RhaT [Bacteroidota bacterium]